MLDPMTFVFDVLKVDERTSLLSSLISKIADKLDLHAMQFKLNLNCLLGKKGNTCETNRRTMYRSDRSVSDIGNKGRVEFKYIVNVGPADSVGVASRVGLDQKTFSCCRLGVH